MKVSELAERAGTSPTTIRFYEAEGVLPAPPRRTNGYRDYDETDVCRTRMVVALRNLGLDLPEAGRLATMCATGRCDETSADLAARIPERRREVAAAMAELAHLDAELAAIEHALASGGMPTNLCTRKEEC
ncbi:MAG TPA: MerR family transcriptional regulator [Candidatus Limnocylindria bacterium]|jgi:MerR family mercuric resistance operon transcriptional regulator|nr:MerR family transcriptional regulator [Candidatus Limnocylindria bacterium]